MLKDDIEMLENLVSYDFHWDAKCAWGHIKKLAEVGEKSDEAPVQQTNATICPKCGEEK